MTQERFDNEVTKQQWENDMEAKVLRITPQIAAELLEGNDSNRRLSEETVKAYAALMERGVWKLNGEAIKVAKNGILLDGQHRLSAVIRSGITIECLVVFGIDNQVFDTLDQGKKRGMSDVLSIKGEANVTALASILRLLCRLEMNPTNPTLSSTVPIDVMENYLIKHPDVRIYAAKCGRANNLGEKSIMGAFWFLFAQKNPELADSFFESIIDGVNLSSGNPVRILRDRLLVNKASNTSKIPTKVIAALIVKAWNAYRLGKDMKHLQWREEETFPQII